MSEGRRLVPNNVGNLVLKLAVISLVVGLLMSFFDVTPADLIRNAWATVQRAWELVVDFVQWGGKYILLGAVVVVPIWGLIQLLNYFSKRKG